MILKKWVFLKLDYPVKFNRAGRTIASRMQGTGSQIATGLTELNNIGSTDSLLLLFFDNLVKVSKVFSLWVLSLNDSRHATRSLDMQNNCRAI